MKKIFLLFYCFIFVVSFSSCTMTNKDIKSTETETNIVYIKSKAIDAKFVRIKNGTFLMGSSENEVKEAADNDESPKHPIKISKNFYIQETETTQKQWEKVMGNNPSEQPHCDDCPVNNVSWLEIQTFIKKLNEIESTNKYRLPTEAEWEYIARAGTTTPFTYGECLYLKDANFNGGSYANCKETGKPKNKLMPVKSYRPNNWGIYDVHGNIFELCNDWKISEYPSSLTVDPQGSKTPQKGKSLRGGSYLFNANRARSANRTATWINGKGGNIGFRLARDL